MRDAAFTRDWSSSAMRHIVEHMRAEDAREVFAVMDADDIEIIMLHLYQHYRASVFFEIMWAPDLLGVPVGFVMLSPIHPGVCTAQMLATDAIRPRHLVLWARRLRPRLTVIFQELGLHRAECSVILENEPAASFLSRCGWRNEGIARQRGRGREDFWRFAALIDDFTTQPEEGN